MYLKKNHNSEQYFPRNFLLVHRVKEQEQENKDVVLNVLKEHLHMELSVKYLDKFHRFGKHNSENKCTH